jgi:hypothetical protein
MVVPIVVIGNCVFGVPVTVTAQLSVAFGAVGVTGVEQVPITGDKTGATGAWVSVTVTLNWQLLELPSLSVTVTVTGVTPTGKDPAGYEPPAG